MIVIKPCDAGAIPVIRQLAMEIWPEAYGDILSPRQLEYMLDMMYSPSSLETQMNKGHQFIIAWQGERAVAFASYSATGTTNHYRLHKIYISTALQGKGIGQQLLVYICNEITAKGALSIELNVNRNNKAIQFYKKMGFDITREEDNDIGEGFFMNDYVMQKNF